MESNYIKSARIKLQKLGITDYETFKNKHDEVMEIVEETIWKEWERKIQESFPHYTEFTPASGYMEFVATRSIPKLLPESKPWTTPQALEHYTRNQQIERITL